MTERGGSHEETGKQKEKERLISEAIPLGHISFNWQVPLLSGPFQGCRTDSTHTFSYTKGRRDSKLFLLVSTLGLLNQSQGIGPGIVTFGGLILLEPRSENAAARCLGQGQTIFS